MSTIWVTGSRIKERMSGRHERMTYVVKCGIAMALLADDWHESNVDSYRASNA